MIKDNLGLIIMIVVLLSIWLWLIIKALQNAIKKQETVWTVLFIISIVLVFVGGVGVFVGFILIGIYWATRTQREEGNKKRVKERIKR